ncbi:(d)CMP kinase [Nordella sp. HKS 07]|uniref:(d)CMP kinase n=1 Tax=Nordella sp. HKS 07 TaxID=2712222 RepID=UPI0013E19EBF|nr:(d)CMP kinase [Nordella sp. HKS 07]QIG48356.1 (d)CMP kinase [Nordella sp. HKS 07]
MIIAVDGPAAAGKGTLARALARHYNLHFLDTGALYRMVGLSVLAAGGDPHDGKAALKAAETLRPDRIRDEDLRSEAVGEAASVVAVNPQVRTALLGFQRAFARKQPGAVLDGRDIGTVVCPDAQAKIFVTASAEVRARRRHAELAERGAAPDFAAVLADIQARDERDRSRAHAPLIPAADAYVLDSSALSREEALAKAIAYVETRKAG